MNWWFQPTPLKNMLVKMGSSSPNRDENKKIFELPPTSWMNDCGGLFGSFGDMCLFNDQCS